MPLTTAQQVRLRIQDPFRWSDEVLAGDGSGSGFKLRQGSPYSVLSAASAYTLLPSPTGWSATGATIDTALGTVKFSAVISANTAFRVEYQWAVFGDEEIGLFTAVGGSVPGAALEAVRTLLFDSLRRHSWSAPDGTSYDDTAAMNQLKEMHAMLLEELREGPEGGIESWGEQQELYSGWYSA